MKKRKRKSGAFLFGLVIAALATVGYGAGQGWFRAEEAEALEGVPVRRGPLRISELSRGNLESKNAVRLINRLEGQSTIIELAEEGTYVEEGDLVCAFDVSSLEDRRVTQQIDVNASEAELTKSVEQYEIQKIQNESDRDEAELALELARLDLEKYVDLETLPEDYDPSTDDIPQDGEWAHELTQAKDAIHLAQLELAQAEEDLRWTEELHEKGFETRTALERDTLSVEQAKIQLEQARREYDLARKFGYQRRLAELKAAVQRADRDIEKVRKQAVARLADLKAERESDRYRLERERERMKEIERQLEYGKIYAPISGILVYSRDGGRRRDSGDVPQEGGTVHERREIATIPREGGMTVDVSLHETKLDNVKVGQEVLVKVDAIPGRVFTGRVDYVAAVADSGHWMSNPNQRLYKTEVALDEAVPKMRPGMSCEVEILVEDLQDVLYVPRQAIYLDGGRTVCFVSTPDGPEPRTVRVGLGNAKWTVIEEGLSEGETVLLSPPQSWQPSEAEDEGEPSAPGTGDEEGAGSDREVTLDRGGPPGGPDTGEGGRPGRRGPDGTSDEQRGAALERMRNMSAEERRAARERFRRAEGGEQ